MNSYLFITLILTSFPNGWSCGKSQYGDDQGVVLALPDPPKNQLQGVAVAGWVTVITKDSLTLDVEPDRADRGICMPGGRLVGSVENEDVLVAQTKQYRISAPLGAGLAPVYGAIDIHRAYRLADIKTGDLVWISTRVVENVDVCDSITILRRPNGVIPQAPSDPKNQFKYHERINEEEAREAKGLPRNPNRKVKVRVPICDGLSWEDDKYYVFDANGPWYVRILIVPRERGANWTPSETWRKDVPKR